MLISGESWLNNSSIRRIKHDHTSSYRGFGFIHSWHNVVEHLVLRRWRIDWSPFVGIHQGSVALEEEVSQITRRWIN
jgi:hypothetical protein